MGYTTSYYYRHRYSSTMLYYTAPALYTVLVLKVSWVVLGN